MSVGFAKRRKEVASSRRSVAESHRQYNPSLPTLNCPPPSEKEKGAAVVRTPSSRRSTRVLTARGTAARLLQALHQCSFPPLGRWPLSCCHSRANSGLGCERFDNTIPCSQHRPAEGNDRKAVVFSSQLRPEKDTVKGETRPLSWLRLS